MSDARIASASLLRELADAVAERPDEVSGWAELQRQVLDAQANTMNLVKCYRQDKGDVQRVAEAQELLNDIEARRGLIDELVPSR